MSRTIVITGGARGIGRAVASLCVARGDRVAILDKDAVETPLVLSLVCDVTDEAQVKSAFEEVVVRLGTPWGVFANAGIDLGGPLHELQFDRWRQLLETNLTGTFLTCKHALQLMVEARAGGSLVCTSSIAALTGFAAGGAAAYSATKGGVSSLVRCLAVDYARYGIRVNAVLPGSTETRMMWSNFSPEQIPRLREQVCREIPLGRIAEPEEPARAALWLLSDDSSYVTERSWYATEACWPSLHSHFRNMETIADFNDLCGEGPLWDPAAQALYSTDTNGRRFHRYSSRTRKAETLHGGFDVGGFGRCIVASFPDALPLAPPGPPNVSRPAPTRPSAYTRAESCLGSISA